MTIKLHLQIDGLSPDVSEEDFIGVVKGFITQQCPNCKFKDLSYRGSSSKEKIQAIENLINDFYEPETSDERNMRSVTMIRNELFKYEKLFNPTLKLDKYFTAPQIGMALTRLGMPFRYARKESIGYPYPTKFYLLNKSQS